MKSDRILFILKVPPPVHGSTMMNKIIADSSEIAKKYHSVKHEESISRNVDEISKFTFRKIFKIIVNYFRLLKILTLHRPTLVYFAISPIGKAFYKDLISITLIKIFRVRVVYHFHVKGIKTESDNSIFKKYFFKYCFKNQFAIVLSEKLLEDFDNLNFKKIFVVPNGIKESEFAGLVSENESYTITYLSNFIKEKGVLEFIDVINELKNEGIEFQYNIIGGDSDILLTDLNSIIKGYDLEGKSNHIGPAYGVKKEKLLRDSNLFIFPTHYKKECYPLVLLEAMQFSLPIITSNEGAISDIVIDGKNGFIVDPFNTNSMKEKAIKLIENKEISIRMGDHSRNLFLQNNTIEKFENNINQVIDAILNESYE